VRYVYDTNVIVSAALSSGSISRLAFDKSVAEGTILMSVPAVLELAEVLGREKLDKYLLPEERLRFLVALLRTVNLVEVTDTIRECRDPRDNKFLELAVSGKADLIVTGDDDLLVLNPFRGIPIVTARQFLTP